MTNQTCRNLIDALLSERPELTGIEIPDDEAAQFRLYRSLVNIRPADSASAEYLSAEDAFLQEMTRRKGITTVAELKPADDHIYL